ncbi:MAG: maleylacetoacetate isomerase [Anderseniella sp.]|jgi:maleylacetoacetate isomerase|nr:maleylacetoacetate isomerase [Anderseniella sp.]
MTDSVILHDYWRSSAAYRVRIALNLAGISYRPTEVDLLDKSHKSSGYLALNPQGLVPALEIDGHILTQSLAIIGYLSETRALTVLPDEPYARARVNAAAMALSVDLHPVCNLQVVHYATGADEPARSKWMKHFITPGLAAFEKLIDGFDGPYCCGDQPSLADICMMPQLYNADRWGATYSACAKIMDAQAACQANPAFIAAHPDMVNPY